MRPNENEIKATTEHHSPTIFAAFDDPHRAESAAGALLDHGVQAERISLVMNAEAKQKQGTADDPELAYTQPTLVSGPAGATNRFDPLGNDLRQSTPFPIQGANNFPVGENAEIDGALNPAQNDYPRSGSDSPTEFSSRPPNSRSDFNPDLDRRDYNANYVANVDRENQSESARDAARRNAENTSPEGDEGLEVNRPAHPDPDSAHEAERTIGPAAYDSDRAAKHGITTTTIGDAASAAKIGVVAGLGIGALAAAAALAIPGVGLVIGGGALATALAGLAATTGAGAIAGGVVGYLKDQGIPGTEIPRYQRAYEGGGAILSVNMESEAEREEIEAVIRKYGAISVDRYGYSA